MGVIFLTMIRLGFLTLGFIVALSLQDDFQDFMDQTKEDYKMLGMTIGAFKANEWILKGQIGVRNADDPTPIGENDKFVLEDAGRSITAMLAARIVETSEGMITWESTVGEVLGESINVQSPFAESTLLDLLVHRGQILNTEQVMENEFLMDWYDQVWAASQWSMPEENLQQRLELLTKFLVNVECEENTCENEQYSTFTYSVAVTMLEMFTGKTFDAMLEEEEFGLGPTTLDQSLPPSQPWSHFSGPWGVYNIPILPGNQTNMPSVMAPDVGIHCSMESWKNFLSAQVTKNESYLSKENWDILQTPQINIGGRVQYAPGFVVEDNNPFSGPILSHPSVVSDKGYAQCIIAPAADIGIVMAVNSNMQGGMRQMVGMNKILEYVESHIQQTYGISIGVENLQTLHSLL